MRAPDMTAELFKLLRSRALSRRQISEELEWHHGAVDRWVAELTAHGMLVERQALDRLEGARTGSAPMVYSLAREWGGVA